MKKIILIIVVNYFLYFIYLKNTLICFATIIDSSHFNYESRQKILR